MGRCRRRGRGRGRTAATAAPVGELPITINNTYAFRSEETEKPFRQVEPHIGTARALIHDGGLCRLAIVRHNDRLEAKRTRVTTAKLVTVQGNNKVTRHVRHPASTQSDSIESPSSVIKSPVKLNIAPGTLSNVTVAMRAGTVRFGEN